MNAEQEALIADYVENQMKSEAAERDVRRRAWECAQQQARDGRDGADPKRIATGAYEIAAEYDRVPTAYEHRHDLDRVVLDALNRGRELARNAEPIQDGLLKTYLNK